MFGGQRDLSGGTAMERTLDKLTVITAVVFGLCTFWLAGSGTLSRPADPLARIAPTSEWRNLVDALG